jgi:cytochrome c-type biogenesis protein CcmH/NrfF
VSRLAAALLGAALLVVPAAAVAPPTQHEVEESLTCQCGCGLTVHACNHLQCSSGDPIKKEIARRIASGEDKATILAAFRAQYGEKILSSPTFQGFNWIAWIMPFAAVLGGGIGISLVIRRWTRTSRPPPAPPGATPPADEERRKRLARELEDFDREE